MKKHKNHSKVFKIDGIGVNLKRFHSVSKDEKNRLRNKIGFSERDFILVYTAEFIPRKNHKLIFDILPVLKENIPELKMVFCGKGELFEYYQRFAAADGFDYVVFTGYTKEVDIFYAAADICISTSLQEGQGLNLVEAMACGLPVIASDIRGHKDVIQNGYNGILCDLDNPKAFINAILLLYKNPSLREEMGKRNVQEAAKYSVEIAVEKMAHIYGTLAEFNGGGDVCRVIFAKISLPSSLSSCVNGREAA